MSYPEERAGTPALRKAMAEAERQMYACERGEHHWSYEEDGECEYCGACVYD